MQNGQYTSRAITQMYLDRIEAIDKNGPKLNAVIEINPDALTIADAMDQERKDGKIRGPLHGIPVLIKDNIDTADKMSTSAGSLALADNKATQDAFIVKKLRDAGAVILGKTNLSEWANFRSTRSTSGWSSRGGQTSNPYVLDRTPCGSSSGSGVVVAANLCAVAVGTETDGSVVCPAAVNGIVGLKPTVGLLSRIGHYSYFPNPGYRRPHGPNRNEMLLFYLMSLLALTRPMLLPKKAKAKYSPIIPSFLDANGLQGKRIGVEKSFLKGHPGIDVLFQKALDLLKSKGATIVEVEIMKKMGN